MYLTSDHHPAPSWRRPARISSLGFAILTALLLALVASSAQAQSSPIVPYISVDGGSTWTLESSATVSSTSTVVDIGPQPVSGGSWAWTGPNGFTSTSRQINSIALSSGANVYTAKYTVNGTSYTQAFTITVGSNPIVPYLSVNGTWQNSSSVTVASGSVVDLGPQPVSGGSWAWTGPNGFTSTSRQINSIALSSGTNVYTAKYTINGTSYTQAFTITVNSGGSGGATTAWYNGTFNVNVANVVAQSNVILHKPNVGGGSSMMLGNGNVGVALQADTGMNLQINRTDTFPNRESLGWLQIPGLSVLTGASNYTGKLDIYNGQFVESGGGMTATVFIRTDKDEIVVEVTGANPNTTQTAQILLWSPRTPTVQASGSYAAISEVFPDPPYSVNYGALAGITASGENVTASVVNSLTIQVSFKPHPDGTFAIIVAAPSYNGTQIPMATVENVIGSDTAATASSLQSATIAWWNNFWANTGLIHITSADGGGGFVENSRDINLFMQAGQSSGAYPGHESGVTPLYNYDQDTIPWGPGQFVHWNSRMFTGSNMAAGHPELNTPYFNLYATVLSRIQAWTQQQFTVGNGSNACVPELMSFNGTGDDACMPSIAPNWDALTLSTGPEVSDWIWQQYLFTRDLNFLRTNFPVMAASAEFYLAYATQRSDGKLHMSPTNAHEDQWSLNDSSMNDICAMKTMFPATIQAAQLLNTDASLVSQLQAAIPKIQDYPRTDIATQTQLLTASSDAGGQDKLSPSFSPSARFHNVENDDLEPVWPYGLIGDNSSLTALAQRTWQYRKYPNQPDWTFDAVQAARLGLSSDFYTSIVNLISKYSVFVSGAGSYSGSHDHFYDEMNGGLMTAVQEALVQDYDGLLRFAPAWPSGTSSSNWDVDGTVYIPNNSKVHVQIENGNLVTAVVESGANQSILTRNPWGTTNVEVVDSATGSTVVGPTTASQFSIPASSGHAYIIEQVGSPTTALPHAQVTATPATSSRTVWGRTIGM